MNIWDSVQRGLEKASNEAARIAKAQRLRSTLDGLSKQIETQQGAIVISAMELFKSGKLTQSELLPICQALTTSQQQFVQAQNELKAIQSVSNTKSTQAQQVQQNQSNTTEAFTHTPYQPYDEPVPSLVPPPPPDEEMDVPNAAEATNVLNNFQDKSVCSNCGTPLVPNNAFCHNCGSPVNTDSSSNQATVRASSEGEEYDVAKFDQHSGFDFAELSTIRMKEDEPNEQNNSGKPHNGGN